MFFKMFIQFLKRDSVAIGSIAMSYLRKGNHDEVQRCLSRVHERTSISRSSRGSRRGKSKEDLWCHLDHMVHALRAPRGDHAAELLALEHLAEQCLRDKPERSRKVLRRFMTKVREGCETDGAFF
jgi:hypothetical protein